MTQSAHSQKIIWAVDPISGERSTLSSAAWAIRGLSKSVRGQVQPVYLWKSSPIEVPVAPFPDFFEELKRRGQETLDAVLSRVKVPDILPLDVLSQSYVSLREETQALATYAKERDAELIVVSSHGRRGMKRWILGSFTETLALYSDTPLLVVHPGWRRTPDFRRILFPSDFSETSIEAFELILDFAAKQKSHVTLFHKMNAVNYPTFDLALSWYAYYEKALKEETATNEILAERLADLGRERGVRVDVVFDRTKSDSIPEVILKRAKQLNCMIALSTQGGPVSSVIMGSTTRHILRHASAPVWVVHPRPHAPGEVIPRPLATDIARDPSLNGRVSSSH